MFKKENNIKNLTEWRFRDVLTSLFGLQGGGGDRYDCFEDEVNNPTGC